MLHFWHRVFNVLGASWPSIWVQLGPQDGSGAAQEPPERSLQITQEASWSQEPPKSRPEPSKTPQGGAQTPSKPRFWSIWARISFKNSTIFQSFWKLDFE